MSPKCYPEALNYSQGLAPQYNALKTEY